MPKDKERTTPAKRKAPRKSQMFRFTAETAKMLKLASERAGMSKTVYVMLALKHQFQADGLLPPDPIFAPAPRPPDEQKARSPRGTASQANKGQG
jgi:hypothetical protein